MNNLEQSLYQAVVGDDQESVIELLKQGANPNKLTSCGMTCLGQAASSDNIAILKLLINSSIQKNHNKKSRRSSVDYQNKKLRYLAKADTNIKKSNERYLNKTSSSDDKNQGYYVFIHNDGSSSDKGRVPPVQSPLVPASLTPSPQGDMEWDEEIGRVAATTSEDVTWSSLYKWYASILESTGAALASETLDSYDINQQDVFSKTALHHAAALGRTSAVKLLIDSGCKIDIAAIDGLTPLHLAAIKNHTEIAKLLLSAGSNVNVKNHDKMTPLHFAASHGFLEMVKILISSGPNLEARNTDEQSALYLAAGGGHVEVVGQLVAAGANVNGEDLQGYTPLCEAVWRGGPAVAALLLARGARVTFSHKLLHSAIMRQQDTIVQLLSCGGGINLHDDNGDTPLLLAARLGHAHIARTLLANGANVNACNSITGSNALHIAVEGEARCFQDLLLCLIEHDIDMNLIALIGDTALNRALLLHKDHAAALLIKYGANVNICDLHSCGLDNLTIAARRRSPALAALLLRAGHAAPPPPPPRWLHDAGRNPLTLGELTRIAIRRPKAKGGLYKHVQALPLPNCLKRYLMMEDEFP